MRKDYCDITFVLDRSGSMGSIKSSTIEGYNRFLKDQKDVEGLAKMTLIQFDNEYEVNYEGQDIADSIYLDNESYLPRATTALLDAIGKAIVSTGNRLSMLSDDERPDKVVFVILTDGDENASKEYTNEMIGEMIKHQTEVYNWQFMFLGANQDAIATARSINISADLSMNFYSNDLSNSKVYSSLSKSMGKYRCAGVFASSQDLSFSDDDRSDQEKSK